MFYCIISILNCCILAFLSLNRREEKAATTSIVVKDISVTEAVARRCSVKKVFINFSQNKHGNTSVGVSFLIKLQS